MKRAFLITAAVVGVLIAALVWVGEPRRWPPPETPPQQGEAAERAMENAPPVHAPHALERLVREPQNAWSNLAFVFGGALLVSTAASKLARCVGVAVVAVGVGSFLYHASASRVLRQLDVGAMYWTFLATAPLCVAAIFPRWREKCEQRAGVFLGMGLVAAAGLVALRNVVVAGGKPFSLRFATVLAAAMVILALAQVARRRETVSLALQLLGIVTLLGAAVAFHAADRPGGRLFKPDALVQAHAVWHVLAAALFVWAVRLLDREVKHESPAEVSGRREAPRA